MTLCVFNLTVLTKCSQSINFSLKCERDGSCKQRSYRCSVLAFRLLQNWGQHLSSLNIKSAHMLLLNLLPKELQVLWIKNSCLVLSLLQGKKLCPVLCLGCRLIERKLFHGSSDSCQSFFLFKFPDCLLVITSDAFIETAAE